MANRPSCKFYCKVKSCPCHTHHLVVVLLLKLPSCGTLRKSHQGVHKSQNSGNYGPPLLCHPSNQSRKWEEHEWGRRQHQEGPTQLFMLLLCNRTFINIFPPAPFHSLFRKGTLMANNMLSLLSAIILSATNYMIATFYYYYFSLISRGISGICSGQKPS